VCDLCRGDGEAGELQRELAEPSPGDTGAARRRVSGGRRDRGGLSADRGVPGGTRPRRREPLAADTDDATTGTASARRHHRHRRHPPADGVVALHN